MWCHFCIAYFLSVNCNSAVIQVLVCQSIPEGIFQNNLHFIIFTRSKQYRHMENCASKPIPVLTRLRFSQAKSLPHFLMPCLSHLALVRCVQRYGGPCRAQGTIPSGAPHVLPLVLLLNYSSSMDLLATWGFASKKINNQKKKKSLVKVLKLDRIWQITDFC